MLNSWTLVEGALASTFGYSLQDVMTMSWRRFRVVLEYLFATGALGRPGESPGNTHEQQAQRSASATRLVDEVNWDALTGKDTSGVTKTKVDFSDFMKTTGTAPTKVI